MEPPPRKTNSDPTRPTSDADAVISDTPRSPPTHRRPSPAGHNCRRQARPEFASKNRARDLTPQERHDFIREYGFAMLPPDGEG
jgi:hypothetical protein